MGFSQIDLQYSSLPYALLRLFLFLNLDFFQKCFHKLCKKVFNWERNKEKSKRLRKDKRLIGPNIKYFC